MQLLATRQRREDKKARGKRENRNRRSKETKRVSVMTQLNLAGPHTFGLEAVWTADMWSLGKEILLFDWCILGESWGIWSCAPDIYESCYLFGSVQSGAQTTLQTWTPTCICSAVCLFVFVREERKKNESDDFSRSSKIQTDWNMSISSALCECVNLYCKCGDNCFPELFAGIKGNLALFNGKCWCWAPFLSLLWASKPGVTLRSLFCID